MGGWPEQEQASRRSSLPNKWATTTANSIYMPREHHHQGSRVWWFLPRLLLSFVLGGWLTCAGKPIDWHRFDLMSFLFKLSITHFSVLSYRGKVKATDERHTYTRERNERRTTWLALQKESQEIVTSTRYCRCVYAIKSFSISIQPLSRLNSAVKLRQSNSTLLWYSLLRLLHYQIGVPAGPLRVPYLYSTTCCTAVTK